MSEQKFPYRETGAAAMLSSALQRYTSQNPGGLRALAARLGIGQATVLSHMAHGRIGIPLDRVAQFAEILGIDSAVFSLAVLQQRAPEVYAELNNRFDFSPVDAGGLTRPSTVELSNNASIKSSPVDPAYRIAVGNEAAVLELIRSLRPLGLSPTDMAMLTESIQRCLGAPASAQ